MQKLVLLTAAAVVFAGLAAQPSEAAPAWKCAKRNCYWVEGYTGPVPDYATKFGTPSEPGCYYVLSRVTERWRESCPAAGSH